MIRPCDARDLGGIYTIINEAARARQLVAYLRNQWSAVRGQTGAAVDEP